MLSSFLRSLGDSGKCFDGPSILILPVSMPFAMELSSYSYGSNGVHFPFPLIMRALRDEVGVKMCQFWVLAKETLSISALSLVSLSLPPERG